MTGADLALLVNEAALFAARRERQSIEQRDFTDAIEKIVLGTERQIVMTDADRERTAYHEAGHALVGMLTPGADPVRKVSIIPRGQALGVTLSTPDADKYGYERSELLGRIRVMLGGRAAEQVVYGETTTGAESDIQQLTQIARSMVARWGMTRRDRPRRGRAVGDASPFLPGASETSEHVQEIVDAEVRRIVEERRARDARAAARASAPASTRWRRRCSSARRSTRTRPTRSPACDARAPPDAPPRRPRSSAGGAAPARRRRSAVAAAPASPAPTGSGGSARRR